AKMFQDAPDAKFGLRRILVRDDVAIVEWTSTGSLSASAKQRTKARFGANGVSVMHFSPDGLIREQHDIVDSSTLDAQARADKKKRETLMQPTGTPDVRVARGTPDEEKNLGAGEALDKIFDARD